MEAFIVRMKQEVQSDIAIFKLLYPYHMLNNRPL